MNRSDTDGQIKPESRPTKRIKLSPSANDDQGHRPDRPVSPTKRALSPPVSGADSDEEETEKPSIVRRTDLESALPPIEIDGAAIAAYESSQAAKSDALSSEARLSARKWIPGRSSIYVDAFNLALDTVLEDESHLFDEGESMIFKYWQSLSYEAQYLYVVSVTLFLIH